MFLKTQNVSPAAHPVRKELQRVQGYIEKLKAASAQRRSSVASAASGSSPVANVVSETDRAAAQKLLQSLSATRTAGAVMETSSAVCVCVSR